MMQEKELFFKSVFLKTIILSKFIFAVTDTRDCKL